MDTRVGSEGADATLPFDVGEVDEAGEVDGADEVDGAGEVDVAGEAGDPAPPVVPLFIPAHPNAKVVRPKEAQRNNLENGFIGLAPRWINKSGNILESPQKNKMGWKILFTILLMARGTLPSQNLD